MNYDVLYEILDYTKLNKRLDEIVNNKENIFKVTIHKPLGYSACGFPINHYSIGNGLKHIIYFAGCHGNEIIGVDFIIKLMHNLALGKGSFKDFPEDTYTIDFIPLLNPEGYYTTTYGILSFIKDLNNQELERFCYNYYNYYKEDDKVINNVNNIIKDICKIFNLLEDSNNIINKFWYYYHNYEYLTNTNFINYFKLYNIDIDKLQLLIDDLIIKYFPNKAINLSKKHQKIFAKVNLECIPLISECHQKLVNKLSYIYKDGLFPLSTLCNFYANSNGVNLNDNNPYYYDLFKKRVESEKEIYARGRECNILISTSGPIGTPNYDMNTPFKYENENASLLNFLKELKNSNKYFMLFNCHSSGGLIYAIPIFNQEYKDNNLKVANLYINKVNEVYQNLLQENITYNIMKEGSKITGIGDLLREEYPYAFLLELSKMGGNPLGPYGDINNYNLTMICNMEALMSILNMFK